MKLRNVLLLITPSSPGRFAGIAQFARTHGWHLTVADRLTHALDGWTGDGALVTLRDETTTLRYVQTLLKRNIPVVDLTLTRPEVSLPRVAADNPAIGRAAAEHFRARYFRHTAWFSTAWGHQHNLRFTAFKDALAHPPECWAWELDPRRTQTDDWETLSQWLVEHLTATPKPLGVFCFDDADASRVESAALAAGLRIPDDVAILGAGDDEPLCESQTIPLSSVLHDLAHNGYAGAALLEQLMNGESAIGSPILVPPRGIAERRSTDALAVSSPLVKRAVRVYQRDLARPPSTEQVAEELGVSRATLDRAFTADLGIAPAKTLARLRLDEAKRLIRASTFSFAEIAARLGYCNAAYFTNVFRRETGVSPKRWRAKNEQPTVPSQGDAQHYLRGSPLDLQAREESTPTARLPDNVPKENLFQKEGARLANCAEGAFVRLHANLDATLTCQDNSHIQEAHLSHAARENGSRRGVRQ